ncbi:MAG: tRNA uridine-5-carboxymethylaminomethyl(34) synthesis GTPase MnmE, partial [Bacteroidota bacterium]
MSHKPTIIAVATPSGSGAIAVIRLSGPQAIPWVNDCFQSIKPKKLIDQKSHTV